MEIARGRASSAVARVRSSAPSADDGPQRVRRPRALVIDDEQSERTVLQTRLAACGYDVRTVVDGHEGLSILDEFRPDCVLVDLVMPGLDGYSVCADVKARHPDGNVAVVVVSGALGRSERIRAYEAGADFCLQKPVAQIELSACLRTLQSARERDLERRDLAIEHAESSAARADAIRGLDAALGQATGALDLLDPQDADSAEHVVHLLVPVLRREGEEPGRPTHAYIGAACDDGHFRGFVYSSDATGIKRHPGPVRLADVRAGLGPLATGELVNWTRGGEVLDPLGLGDSVIPKMVGGVEAYAALAAGSRVAVLLNFPAATADLQAPILRTLFLQARAVRALVEQAQVTDSSLMYVIGALARASEANDEDTGNHILRVNEFSRVLAEEIGCAPDLVRQIHRLAQMHDVGKIHVRREILRKNGPLTPEEWSEMKLHTLYGVKILGDSPRLEVARQIAIAHHERWDGSGYPYGLAGERIPVAARVVTLADVYDALRSRRSYKPEFDHGRASDILRNGDGRVEPRFFDPAVLAAFERRQADFEAIYESLRDAPPEPSGPQKE